MAGMLYQPINSYQTRLLRLDGDNGFPGSQVSCSLYTADLLHPNVEGFLVRSVTSATESLIEYDALSYAWGSGGKVCKIGCNGLQVLVTENLFEALRALRCPNKNHRYLWVDALCINQDNSSEKNEQVWNMLAIYQKARKVIAWLGVAEHKDMRNVLLATSASSFDLISQGTFDFWGAVEGMSYLFKRPWFKRLWVQQEIFAARKLDFQCGNHCFEWSPLLSDPELLLSLPHLSPHGEMIEDRRWKIYTKATYGIPDDIVAQTDAILHLGEIRKQNLKCFQTYAARKSDRPKFVDALLDTGLLDATNPRDYIYGIIGMTGYPAKPMRIQDWLTARQSEVFIPIDYTADLTSILSAVTWVILMNDGLTIVAQFKALSGNDDDTDHSLPSWVIDWRLSARLFLANQPREEYLMHNFRNSFRTVDSHVQFYKDNKESEAIIPCNKLILRGTSDSRFYIKKNSVWEKGLWRPDTLAWRLKSDVQTTDLIVRMHAFADRGGDRCGGLWLLRPVGNDEYKLLACLPWGRGGCPPFGPPSDAAAMSLEEATSLEPSLDQVRRIFVTTETKRYEPSGYMNPNEWYGPTKEDRESANARAFTIV